MSLYLQEGEGRRVLVFDGGCGFCRAWVESWKQLTGESVEYVAFQEVGERFPQVPREDFAAAVTLIEPHGRVLRGAEAVFTLLAPVRGKGWMLWAYQHVPLAEPLTEAFYGWVARHRGLAMRATKLLWGLPLGPQTFVLGPWLFMRALAAIYAIAFASFGLQVTGLIGEHGVLPVAELLPRAKEALGAQAYWALPTVFWLDANDRALTAVCIAGVVLALALFFLAGTGRISAAARAVVCLALFALYLSLANAGQDFMSFQWDALLLEAGFLAIFLDAGRVTRWLFRWLLFRLIFTSGAVKLLSGDPAWRALAALRYHYETQPLPTPPAWYMHQLPLEFHKLEAVMMFAAELAVPFLFFAPRRVRHFAALASIGLQGLIFVTGNYTFFNLLTVALCFFLLDDKLLARCVSRWVLPQGLKPLTLVASIGAAEAAPFQRETAVVPPHTTPAPALRKSGVSRWRMVVGSLLASFVLLVSGYQMAEMFFHVESQTGYAVLVRVYPFRLVNTYGLFAVMTTSRGEIVLEGSNDGVTWQEYEFKYKPGDVMRRPRWVAPHQPRLDWQMWFAALGSPRNHPWVIRLMVRLLEGRPEVLALLEKNPFPEKPPRFVRARFYEYRFTTREERRQTGAWWSRDLRGVYVPEIALREGGDKQ
ncbi:MAG TPA: lipase maturation factor family protein [Terriglobales bacterium]|nr:lipase maturation factor family protein [Terriglobales bacterium]